MEHHMMLVVTVPRKYAASLRKALGDGGAGKLGKYSHCSFSYPGVGRFLSESNARPSYGKVGTLSKVAEERIEMLCRRSDKKKLIATIRKVHPYEEPAFHFIPVEIT